MAYERRDFAGGAVVTTLASGLSAVGTSFSLTEATGWPDGSNGDFFVVIDPDTSSEEKIRCSELTDTTVTVATNGRGADDTTATTHASGATVKHVFVALDADEANYWVAELAGAYDTAGDLAVADGDDSVTTIAKGANSTFFGVTSGGAQSYRKVAAADVDADIATQAELDTHASDTSSVHGITDTTALALDADVVTAQAAADAAQADATLALANAATFSRTGTLVTGTGTMRFRFPFDATLVHTRLSVGTAPTGAAILVDINKNGTTIFTTQANRPTIAISANAETATTAPDVTAIAAGDYLTVDIDQVGSSEPGADLVVNVYYVLA